MYSIVYTLVVIYFIILCNYDNSRDHFSKHTTMKKALLILIVFISFNSYSQHYYGEWGVSSYDTLDNAISLFDQLQVPSLFFMSDTEVDIGFNFPYFDDSFSRLTVNGQGYVFFGYNWYEIYVYAAHYEVHDQLPIFSDWRMRRDTAGMDILKFEWRNIGSYFDISSPNPTDHRMNFQLWLYENGIIEYRFGEMDLANTPWYSLEYGFTLPTGESVGPWVSIKRREIEEEHFFLCNQGKIEYYVGGALSGDIYHCVPEYGTYMRFIPVELTNTKEKALATRSFNVVPNPVDEGFHLALPHPEDPALANPAIEIYNQMGQQVFSKKIRLTDFIDISSLPSGYYTACLVGASGERFNAKLVKK